MLLSRISRKWRDGYWQELCDMDCDFSINGGDFLTCIPKESSAS